MIDVNKNKLRHDMAEFIKVAFPEMKRSIVGNSEASRGC